MMYEESKVLPGDAAALDAMAALNAVMADASLFMSALRDMPQPADWVYVVDSLVSGIAAKVEGLEGAISDLGCGRRIREALVPSQAVAS